MKVLCFGSLNIDYTYKVDHIVQKGETQSSDSLQVFSGGKGLNQSIALAKAGVETWHAGSKIPAETDGGSRSKYGMRDHSGGGKERKCNYPE